VSRNIQTQRQLLTDILRPGAASAVPLIPEPLIDVALQLMHCICFIEMDYLDDSFTRPGNDGNAKAHDGNEFADFTYDGEDNGSEFKVWTVFAIHGTLGVVEDGAVGAHFDCRWRRGTGWGEKAVGQVSRCRIKQM
jgi:hypothetical protein